MGENGSAFKIALHLAGPLRDADPHQELSPFKPFGGEPCPSHVPCSRRRSCSQHPSSPSHPIPLHFCQFVRKVGPVRTSSLFPLNDRRPLHLSWPVFPRFAFHHAVHTAPVETVSRDLRQQASCADYFVLTFRLDSARQWPGDTAPDGYDYPYSVCQTHSRIQGRRTRAILRPDSSLSLFH